MTEWGSIVSMCHVREKITLPPKKRKREKKVKEKRKTFDKRSW